MAAAALLAISWRCSFWVPALRSVTGDEMMIWWGWASLGGGRPHVLFLPPPPSSNAPAPPSAGRRHRDCRRTVRRTPIRSLPPACLIGNYPTSRPLLSRDVFPQRVLLVFRRLVLPFFDNAHLAQPHSAPSTLLPAFARQALQPVAAPLADFQHLANDHCTILRSFSMRVSRVSSSANFASSSD